MMSSRGGSAGRWPLSLMTTLRLPNARKLVKRGDISRTSLVPPYSGTAAEYGISLDEPTGIDVLDQVRKTEGRSNWHHFAYLEIAERYEGSADETAGGDG